MSLFVLFLYSVAVLGNFFRRFIKKLEYIDIIKIKKKKNAKESCCISDFLIKNLPIVIPKEYRINYKVFGM